LAGRESAVFEGLEPINPLTPKPPNYGAPQTMKPNTMKKYIFEAFYKTSNGMRFHTDYITCNTERLAKEYAKRQEEPYDCKLVSFQQVTFDEPTKRPHISIIDL
jgi:hypothetical protein